jgi:signal transduction histidine kinase
MSNVVGDVLTLAQLEGGNFALTCDDIELCGIAKETIATFQSSDAGRSDDIHFEATVDALSIRADARAVEQMIQKLLSNAAKFSDRGTPINLSIGADPDGSARLSIRDKGIGMTAEEAEAAVKPFRQVDERLERKYEGSGLGLSIVNKLIECHGGYLDIVSAPREGTEVSLYFPTLVAKPRRRSSRAAEQIAA